MGDLIKVSLSVKATSLDHQAEFVTLVAPIARKAAFALVVIGEFANLCLGDFERSLVVNVLVIARAKVVDDADSLTHQIHHVLGVGTAHVVLSENLTDALAEDEADVWNGVLVTQDGADFCRGHARFPHLQNEGLNGILVDVGP